MVCIHLRRGLEVEDLNVKAMQRMWGRKISDLGHAQFLGILLWEMYKNGNHGTKIKWNKNRQVLSFVKNLFVLF
ncbi:MAG: hypothetical protein LBJ36_10440 [Synergistaceae bacterium]|nr:hypothetical protein [Synergistaceae bacterium]